MKKFFSISTLVFISSSVIAQLPEDVLKYSWQPVNGTARISAIGGAMGSLGGDISSTFTNPAGLGFYKTSDFVITPGLSFLKNKADFRDTKTKEKDKYFNLGTSGVVGGWTTGNGAWKSKAVSFAVTRTANFSNKIFYTGINDFSSGAEQYAAEAASSGYHLDTIPDLNFISFGTRMAAYNFLVDAANIPGRGAEVISLAMYDQLVNGGDFLVTQMHNIETSGGITEPSIAFAANNNDKFYIGGAIGVPIVKYRKESLFREDDATGNTDNNFDFYELNETFTTKGVGINAKFGVIVKPVDFFRLGLAVHSPTWYSLEDSYEASMSVNLDNYRTTPGTTSVTSTQLNGGVIPTYKYEFSSPWKVMLSGAYVLREIEDVTKQKGFITADVEYVGYKSNRFRSAEDYDDDGYYDEVNGVIKDYYKGALNFRVGGELKFTTIMTRLGFAYYGNPYKDKELKANKMFLSGGLGYRNKGIFIDVTYVHSLQKDVSFPYRLPDKANTFATLNGRNANIMLTVGFKI